MRFEAARCVGHGRAARVRCLVNLTDFCASPGSGTWDLEGAVRGQCRKYCKHGMGIAAFTMRAQGPLHHHHNAHMYCTETQRTGRAGPTPTKHVSRSHPNKTRGATPSMADGADAPTPHSETTKYGTRGAIPYLHTRATRAYVSAPHARAAHVGHITRPLPSHTLGAHPAGREPAHVWLLARHLI